MKENKNKVVTAEPLWEFTSSFDLAAGTQTRPTDICPVSIIPLPFRRSRFHTPLPLPYALACWHRWLTGQLRNETTEKIELDPIAMEERLRQLFAIYGSNGTEFSYVIFTKQRNFTMVERRNGIGRMAKEWWNQALISCLQLHCCAAALWYRNNTHYTKSYWSLYAWSKSHHGASY